MNGDNGPIRSHELQKFSQNAADLLLSQDRLREFFAALDYEVQPRKVGYQGMCPVCLQSFCFIGVNGTYHRIFWKCYDKRCRSNTSRGGPLPQPLGPGSRAGRGPPPGVGVEDHRRVLGVRRKEL